MSDMTSYRTALTGYRNEEGEEWTRTVKDWGMQEMPNLESWGPFGRGGREKIFGRGRRTAIAR